MKKLLAFHNDEKIKEKYVARVKAHKKADEIIQGTYWENGKGCAVGCTVERSKNPHERFEIELGIPKSLAYLEDRIFEGISNSKAKDFPLEFLEAINVGAGLSKVHHKFLYWLLVDETDGVIRFADKKTEKAIRDVAELHRRSLTEEVSNEEWMAAGAAEWAADAAAWETGIAAWTAIRAKQSEKLIQLLKEEK